MVFQNPIRKIFALRASLCCIYSSQLYSAPLLFYSTSPSAIFSKQLQPNFMVRSENRGADISCSTCEHGVLFQNTQRSASWYWSWQPRCTPKSLCDNDHNMGGLAASRHSVTNLARVDSRWAHMESLHMSFSLL